ncbi:MAG: hypothetical protein DMF72_04315 [Acidobacteria bacterium]|nr:MAG: hypothetical protein DMF72_04315 [Acidobacteriota bacterium]
MDRSCGGEFRRAAASVAVFLREMDKNSKMKKLRRLGLLFLINAVILLPLVYGFEFFFRWKDPHKNLPINGWVNGEYFTWGHKVTTNRFGLRERDFQVPKPRGAFRIIVLGDSLTWGVGLATNERYSELLEQGSFGRIQRYCTTRPDNHWLLCQRPAA